MPRRTAIAFAALLALAAPCAAQYPWGPTRHDPYAPYLPTPPLSGGANTGMPGSVHGRPPGHFPGGGLDRVPMPGHTPAWRPPTPYERRRDEDDDRRGTTEWVRAGARAIPHVYVTRLDSPRGDVSHVRVPPVKPSGSWGRGWVAGIAGAIGGLFAAVFGARRKAS
jgi:hypothetical protein